MDSRYVLYNQSRLTELQEQLDVVLALLADGGTTAALLDSLVTQMNIMLRCSQNKSFTLAGLTIGSVAPEKIKAANSVTYLNDGLLYTTTTFETTFGATAATTVPISSFTKYLVTLKAGTPKVTEGNNAASAALALLPAVPAGEAPIGYLQVATSAGGEFIPDTTSLADAAVTDTYVDLAWPDSGVDALTALAALTHPTDAALGALA
jgi:hypothetical protein